MFFCYYGCYGYFHKGIWSHEYESEQELLKVKKINEGTSSQIVF